MKLHPLYNTTTLTFYTADTTTELPVPLAAGAVHAGFPSPAEDYTDDVIDLNKELVRNPNSTFYARVKGMSMQDAGIVEGDLLVIDKSLPPVNGKIAVCYIDGSFTLKRLRVQKSRVWLIPENEAYQPIEITEENDFMIWGMVSYVIKKLL